MVGMGVVGMVMGVVMGMCMVVVVVVGVGVGTWGKENGGWREVQRSTFNVQS